MKFRNIKFETRLPTVIINRDRGELPDEGEHLAVEQTDSLSPQLHRRIQTLQHELEGVDCWLEGRRAVAAIGRFIDEVH